MFRSLFISILFPQLLWAASDTREVLRNLAGCFQVDYRFVENGEHDKAILNNYELIESIGTGDELVFQHWGIFSGQVIKHWSEKWEAVEGGQWKQTVYGPSGGFRYECTAAFQFNQWRCATTGAGKPVRDRNRTDYVSLNRENTLQITPAGWIQAERNEKVDAEGRVVANEVGWIEYRRADMSNCQPGQPQ